MGRLRSLRDWQANQPHFEILGVTRESAPGDARRAFVTLAKQYHPDRFKRESEETQQLAAEIFTNISVAHDCLSDPTARTKYVEALQAGNQDGREIARILSAEKEFGRGEDCLRARDYPKALEHFEAAIELDGNEGEFWAASGWALFVSQGKDTEMRVEALKRLKKAVAMSPRSPIGYYYMAMFHKACEDPSAAERMFRKTLDVSPEHAEATRELRLFQMRKGGGGGGRPGGLFGLGRKK